RAIPSYAVAGSQEACVAAGVHMQQLARTGPLVAVCRLLRRPRRPRQSRSLEHLPDGRVGKAGGASDQPRPPAGGAPAAANALLQFGCKPSGRVGRATRAIAKRLRSAPAVTANDATSDAPSPATR